MKISFASKTSITLLAMLCAFLGNLRYQQWKNQRVVEQEKRDLEQQIAGLQQKNQDLSDSLSYLGSSDFKDRIARQQLNLKRNGEVVFGFSDAPTATPIQTQSQTNSDTPNAEKWVEYFFGTN